MVTDPWLTTDEACEITGVSVRTIRSAIRRGELRASTPGTRSYRIRQSDLELWFDENLVHPESHDLSPRRRRRTGGSAGGNFSLRNTQTKIQEVRQ